MTRERNRNHRRFSRMNLYISHVAVDIKLVDSFFKLIELSKRIPQSKRQRGNGGITGPVVVSRNTVVAGCDTVHPGD